MGFIKSLALRRFNFIDLLNGSMLVANLHEEMYVKALLVFVACFVVSTLLELVAEGKP